mmetsp:Transcript_10613/g.18635  ORF Transcript_10613/g.18635 Transcript_10613/m.18635 type:complete len:231 (-) Transcript_10613:894-1586(-)
MESNVSRYMSRTSLVQPCRMAWEWARAGFNAATLASSTAVLTASASRARFPLVCGPPAPPSPGRRALILAVGRFRPPTTIPPPARPIPNDAATLFAKTPANMEGFFSEAKEDSNVAEAPPVTPLIPAPVPPAPPPSPPAMACNRSLASFAFDKLATPPFSLSGPSKGKVLESNRRTYPSTSFFLLRSFILTTLGGACARGGCLSNGKSSRTAEETRNHSPPTRTASPLRI